MASAPNTGPKIVEANFVAAATTATSLPPPISVEVAFAGRSNVGKSSLMNRLMERKSLVRTSSTPGCTRQIAFYETQSADGVGVTLVDLPGYGYAKRSKSEKKAWAKLIEGYLAERPTLALVVLLVDVRRGLEDDDRALIELLAESGSKNRRPPRVLIAATKLDKVPASGRKPALAKFRAAAELEVIGFSAKDGTGRAELWRRIRDGLGIQGAS